MSVPRQKEASALFAGVLLITAALTGLVACGSGGGTQETAPAGGPPLTTDVPRQIPDTGNPRGDAGTISFEATASGNDSTNTLLLAAGAPGQTADRLSVLQDGTYLRVLVSNSAGEESNVAISIANWEPGQHHAITFTWGDGEERVYVDGQLAGTVGDLGGFRLQAGTPLYIGSVPPARGTITDFHAFNRPLTPDEVATLYPAAPGSIPTPGVAATPTGPAPQTALRVLSTSLTAAESAGTVCVELTGSGGLVAGTQNDLVWDPGCLAITNVCEAAQQHGKSVRTGVPYHGRFRTIVFSLTDTNPIDDGVLYCCSYQIVALASGGCCAVGLEDVLGSDSVGKAIPMDGVAGQVCLR